MEIGLFLSQFFFLQFMVPEGIDWSFWQVMEDFFQSEGDAFPFWLMALIAAAYFVSMSLTSWFYIGGGFALYVNSRTWSEGWDIELAFKRLGQRIGLVVFAMSLFFVVSVLGICSSGVLRLRSSEESSGSLFIMHRRLVEA